MIQILRHSGMGLAARITYCVHQTVGSSNEFYIVVQLFPGFSMSLTQG